MKIIISENQLNQLDLEKKSDLLYKLIQSFYPNNYESDNSNNETEVFDDEDEGNLLFYYNFDTKEFYVGTLFINSLFEATGLPFLDYTEVRTNKRGMFNSLIKVFAKRHYGWDVNSVWFHWY